MGKIGERAHDAGGAEGLVMGLSLLVMGLKPQQLPPPGCGPVAEYVLNKMKNTSYDERNIRNVDRK